MEFAQLVRRVQAAATPGRVFWAFVASTVFSAWFFGFGPYTAMQDHGGILDERFSDGPGAVLDGVDAMGPDGRATYRSFLAWDLVYPLLQATWMTGFLAIATHRVRWLPDQAVAAPGLALLFDWAENAGFLALLAQHPDGSVGVAWFVVVARSLKLVWNVVAGAAALLFVVHLVMNPVRRG